MIICPKCRAKLGDGSTVCVVCGTSLTGGAPEAPKVPEPAKAPEAPAVPAAAPPAVPPPAVAPAAPAVAPPAQPVSIDLQEKPLVEQSLPRSELIDEKKPEAPPQEQPPKPADAPQYGDQPPKPAAGQPQQQLPPQQPPPPDHPMYQQQYYQQPAQGGLYTHPYVQGQPNQCPRCQHQNTVYFYNDGTALCNACQYRYYWRAPADSLDSFGRDIENIFR